MQAVQVLGFKKSGKTALCVALAEHFAAMGKAVAALKCTHNPRLDKEGTDTAKLLAHCRAVGALAGEESAVFYDRPRPIKDMVSLLTGDVLVAEGGREHAFMPRVLVLRTPEEAADLSDPRLVLAVYGPVAAPGLPHVTDLAELAGLVLARGFLLPGLDCGACGRESCAGLAADILAGKADPGDCAARSEGLSVQVAGENLPLNPFVARILAAGIRGLLSELKGYVPGPVEIRL